MPSRRLSLASGHSGSQSCSKRPSGRLLGLIGRLSHTSACGRCSFPGVFKVHRKPSQMFPGFGGSPKGSFNASEASSIGGHSHSPRASTPHPPELTRRPLRGPLAPVESAQALKRLPSTPRTAETDINHLVGQRSHASTV